MTERSIMWQIQNNDVIPEYFLIKVPAVVRGDLDPDWLITLWRWITHETTTTTTTTTVSYNSDLCCATLKLHFVFSLLISRTLYCLINPGENHFLGKSLFSKEILTLNFHFYAVKGQDDPGFDCRNFNDRYLVFCWQPPILNPDQMLFW